MLKIFLPVLLFYTSSVIAMKHQFEKYEATKPSSSASASAEDDEDEKFSSDFNTTPMDEENLRVALPQKNIPLFTKKAHPAFDRQFSFRTYKPSAKACLSSVSDSPVSSAYLAECLTPVVHLGKKDVTFSSSLKELSLAEGKQKIEKKELATISSTNKPDKGIYSLSLFKKEQKKEHQISPEEKESILILPSSIALSEKQPEIAQQDTTSPQRGSEETVDTLRLKDIPMGKPAFLSPQFCAKPLPTFGKKPEPQTAMASFSEHDNEMLSPEETTTTKHKQTTKSLTSSTKRVLRDKRFCKQSSFDTSNMFNGVMQKVFTDKAIRVLGLQEVFDSMLNTIELATSIEKTTEEGQTYPEDSTDFKNWIDKKLIEFKPLLTKPPKDKDEPTAEETIPFEFHNSKKNIPIRIIDDIVASWVKIICPILEKCKNQLVKHTATAEVSTNPMDFSLNSRRILLNEAWNHLSAYFPD